MLKNVATLSVFLVSMASFSVYAANLYRYKDNQGNIVYDSTVPAEFVKNGYEILNEKGRVIQVVPRALTEKELSQQARDLEQERIDEEERAKQEEADKLLLRLYRHPDEIARMRDEKVEELDAQITALSAMVTKYEEDLAGLRATVEKNEANGRQAPDNILKQIETDERDRDRLVSRIARLQAEKDETITTAEKNIERLTELLDL